MNMASMAQRIAEGQLVGMSIYRRSGWIEEKAGAVWLHLVQRMGSSLNGLSKAHRVMQDPKMDRALCAQVLENFTLGEISMDESMEMFKYVRNLS
jgi:hypothetical protein